MISFIFKIRKAKVNRQLGTTNPGSGPDPKRKIIMSSVSTIQLKLSELDNL